MEEFDSVTAKVQFSPYQKRIIDALKNALDGNDQCSISSHAPRGYGNTTAAALSVIYVLIATEETVGLIVHPDLYHLLVKRIETFLNIERYSDRIVNVVKLLQESGSRIECGVTVADLNPCSTIDGEQWCKMYHANIGRVKVSVDGWIGHDPPQHAETRVVTSKLNGRMLSDKVDDFENKEFR